MSLARGFEASNKRRPNRAGACYVQKVQGLQLTFQTASLFFGLYFRFRCGLGRA